MLKKAINFMKNYKLSNFNFRWSNISIRHWNRKRSSKRNKEINWENGYNNNT